MWPRAVPVMRWPRAAQHGGARPPTGKDCQGKPVKMEVNGYRYGGKQMTARGDWCASPSTGRPRPFRVYRPNWKAGCVERRSLLLAGGEDCKVLPILTHRGEMHPLLASTSPPLQGIGEPEHLLQSAHVHYALIGVLNDIKWVLETYI